MVTHGVETVTLGVGMVTLCICGDVGDGHPRVGVVNQGWAWLPMVTLCICGDGYPGVRTVTLDWGWSP